MEYEVTISELWEITRRITASSKEEAIEKFNNEDGSITHKEFLEVNLDDEYTVKEL